MRCAWRRPAAGAFNTADAAFGTTDTCARAAGTQAFAAELGKLTGLPIHLWDERLTTREAHQTLYEADHARQAHRKVVDQVAAALILQSFLDKKQGSVDSGQ